MSLLEFQGSTITAVPSPSMLLNKIIPATNFVIATIACTISYKKKTTRHQLLGGSLLCFVNEKDFNFVKFLML